MNRSTIALCMIVKNEEEYIRECLKNVRSFVDEIIIVDTGSTDGTKEILNELQIDYIDYKWNSDYSAARNYAISHVKSDWIIMLDADEIMSKEDMIKVQNLVSRKDNCVFEFIRYDYYPGYGISFSMRERLFKRDKELFFEENIFEQLNREVLLRNKYTIAATDVVLNHYGPLKKSYGKKNLTYIEMMNEANVKGSEENQSLLHRKRALIYGDNLEYEKALFEINKAIDLAPDFFSTKIFKGKLLLAVGQYKEAEHAFKESLTTNSFYKPLAYNGMGLVNLYLKNYEVAGSYFSNAIQINSNLSILYINMGRTLELLGEKHGSLINYTKALSLNNELSVVDYNKTWKSKIAYKHQTDVYYEFEGIRQSLKKIL